MTLFPANGEIKLDESIHKYILEGHEEIDFTSVTTCISAFFETFDKNKVAHITMNICHINSKNQQEKILSFI